MTLPALIGRQFDQICFVVEDLDEAVAVWRRQNGVLRWQVVRDLAMHQTEKTYWGQPGDFQFSCAYGFAGDTLIELAHHDGGRSLYGDWLSEQRRGVHHIGFRLANKDEFRDAADHYERLGLVRAMSGFFEGPARSGDCRWAYYDTREQIGCFTELYYVDGPALEQMKRFKAGESDHMIVTGP